MTVKIKISLFFFCVIVSFCGIAWPEDAVQYANLGDFRLENGDVIRNCRVGYLTSGELNSEKSNLSQ